MKQNKKPQGKPMPAAVPQRRKKSTAMRILVLVVVVVIFAGFVLLPVLTGSY